jgi:hypothetical protein
LKNKRPGPSILGFTVYMFFLQNFNYNFRFKLKKSLSADGIRRKMGEIFFQKHCLQNYLVALATR